MAAVEAIDLWKKFDERPVLRGLSFSVDDGEIFGLIGPNGVGKTTTLRILATILRPDRGDARIHGRSVVKNPGEVRRIISYLPEDVGVYKHLTGREYLRINGAILGLRGRELDHHLSYAIEVSGLSGSIDDAMGSYSKGMKKRIMIARTLMGRPRVLILDEPTSGLDIEHSSYIRSLIKRYVKETGAACIISSHNMLEVEHMCDRVALLKDGNIVAEGRPKKLLEEYGAPNLEELYLRVVKK